MTTMMEKKQQASNLLAVMSEELDIPDSKYEDAVSKYEAVGKWLGASESPLCQYKPEIYPQGSINLGTVVKPLGSEEYDVDLVCELGISYLETDQATVKKLVGDRLKANGTYKPMTKEKNRCWQLDYAGDFHMDILPAVPEIGQMHSIKVPDKDLSAWKDSNPKGYAKWFFEQMKPVFLMEKEAMAIQMATKIDDVPDWKVKTPLQRAIQILKRHRDVYFGDDDEKPISIIITTLAAMAYRGQNTLHDTLTDLINKMEGHTGVLRNYIPNPTNTAENFADKWATHPQRKAKFIKWLDIVRQDADALVQATGGLSQITEGIQKMAGEKTGTAIMNRYGDGFLKQRESGTLHAARGTAMLGTVGAAVKPHTFFGK